MAMAISRGWIPGTAVLIANITIGIPRLAKKMNVSENGSETGFAGHGAVPWLNRHVTAGRARKKINMRMPLRFGGWNGIRSKVAEFEVVSSQCRGGGACTRDAAIYF